ncbi:MAG: hypothetical protein K2N82_05610, partial [Lachnospiraceae bacterium]|nr:hypothetical protein [Lachnospiraceae bacterium]
MENFAGRKKAICDRKGEGLMNIESNTGSRTAYPIEQDTQGKQDKGRLIFWGILALAILIRIIGFGSLPNGVNQDEAMGAVDAWALSLYGTDRFGVR